MQSDTMTHHHHSAPNKRRHNSVVRVSKSVRIDADVHYRNRVQLARIDNTAVLVQQLVNCRFEEHGIVLTTTDTPVWYEAVVDMEITHIASRSMSFSLPFIMARTRLWARFDCHGGKLPMLWKHLAGFSRHFLSLQPSVNSSHLNSGSPWSFFRSTSFE
jgi:hypothetical protein